MPRWGYLHCLGVFLGTLLIRAAGMQTLERAHWIPRAANWIIFINSPNGNGWLPPPSEYARMLPRDALDALGFLVLHALLLAWGWVSLRELGFRGVKNRILTYGGLALFAGFHLLIPIVRWFFPAPAREWMIIIHPIGLYFPIAHSSPWALALVVVTGVLLLPILQETFFRGLLYRRLRVNFGVGAASLVSAVAFAFHGYSMDLGLGSTIMLFATGYFCAWLVEASQSLYPAIVASALSNLIALAYGAHQ
jgi:membrane protease YdiL (CAAX protease family)